MIISKRKILAVCSFAPFLQMTNCFLIEKKDLLK